MAASGHAARSGGGLKSGWSPWPTHGARCGCGQRPADVPMMGAVTGAASPWRRCRRPRRPRWRSSTSRARRTPAGPRQRDAERFVGQLRHHAARAGRDRQAAAGRHGERLENRSAGGPQEGQRPRWRRSTSGFATRMNVWKPYGPPTRPSARAPSARRLGHAEGVAGFVPRCRRHRPVHRPLDDDPDVRRHARRDAGRGAATRHGGDVDGELVPAGIVFIRHVCRRPRAGRSASRWPAWGSGSTAGRRS